MSITIAYLDNNIENRVHIDDYDKTKHSGKIYCIDGHALIGRKGTKMIHHFAHKNKDEASDTCCNREMGEWHYWHQARILPDFIEIYMKKDEKRHFADAVNKDGLIIEFQKSIVPPAIIKEREKFYDNMIWIFCCVQSFDIKIIDSFGDILLIEYIQGSTFFIEATKRSFLDFGKKGFIEIIDKLVDTKRNFNRPSIKIIGRIWTLDQFDNTFLKGILIDHADKRSNAFSYTFQIYKSDGAPYRCSKGEIKVMCDAFFSNNYSLDFLYEKLLAYKNKQ